MAQRLPRAPRGETLALLESACVCSSTATYRRSDTIYAQGDACATVLYVRRGRVRLSVVSKTGREATVAVFGPGNFFGQATLAGQKIRTGSATAQTGCIILSIEATELRDRLHHGTRCPIASSRSS